MMFIIILKYILYIFKIDSQMPVVKSNTGSNKWNAFWFNLQVVKLSHYAAYLKNIFKYGI